MSASIQRPDCESTLDAFVGHSTPVPARDDPSPLIALGARLVPGETTVLTQETRGSDRVVSPSLCTRCGAPYDGAGVCDGCASTGDVVDARVRTAGGGH